jgi:hypothetical protein
MTVSRAETPQGTPESNHHSYSPYSERRRTPMRLTVPSTVVITPSPIDGLTVSRFVQVCKGVPLVVLPSAFSSTQRVISVGMQ